MAAEVSGPARAISAVLFMQAGMYTLDAYSTLNSSPWTAESFGGDPQKMKSLREYVGHAMVFSTLYCAGSAIIGASWWPIYGSVINNGYLWWLYRRAAQRGAKAGAVGWGSGVSPGWKGLSW